jgi:tetratricopeptide (TPR) repeat protein
MRTIAIRPGGVGGVVMVAGALLSIGPALALGPVLNNPSPHRSLRASPVQATGPAQRPTPDAADINDCKSLDPDRVIAGCTRLLATDLSDRERASALNNRGAAYGNTGRREQAISDLDAAIRLDATNASAHLNRGLLRHKLDRQEAAIADLTEAIRLKPDWARAFAERGHILRLRGRQGGVSHPEPLALAIADFDEALRLAAATPGVVSDSELGRIFLERGFARMFKGDHAGAIADYDRTLSKDPQHLHALFNRGMSLALLGERDRARADLLKVVGLPAASEADRKNQEVAAQRLAELGATVLTLTEQGSAHSSAAQAPVPEQRAAPDPGSGDCNSKDPDRAIAGCTRAIATDPNDRQRANAHNNRGIAYGDKREHERAIADFDAALRLDPTHSRARFNRGLMQRALGRDKAAIADFTEAIRLRPDWALAFDQRGRILLDLGRKQGDSQHEQLTQAIADFDEALRLAAATTDIFPDDEIGRIFTDRGLARAIKGDHAGAVADFDRTLRKDPQSLPGLLGRSLSLATLGETERARADLQRMVELPAKSESDRQNQEIARKRLAEVEAESKAKSHQEFMRKVQEEYERCIAARAERRACGPNPQSASRKPDVAQAAVEEPSAYMTGDEIMSVFEGNSSDGSMGGSGPYREYYASGGAIRGKGFRGTWWVDGDRFCTAYPGLQTRCYRVRKLGGSHIAWERDGAVVGAGRIVKGNPHRL